MAKRTPRIPSHTDAVLERRQLLCGRFEACLKSIAEQLAAEVGAENVMVAHVDHARQTLKRFGLSPSLHGRKFWHRPDFKVGFGSLVFGAAATMSSFVKDAITAYGPINEHPFAMWAFMIIVPAVIAFGGASLAIYGWVQATYGSD